MAATIFKKPTVHGTGLVALDIVISSDTGKPHRQWAGGTCGNVLTILSYLGWKSYPIARLNNGSYSSQARRDTERWKVCQDFMGMKPVACVPVITQKNYTDKTGYPQHRFYWKNCPNCGSWLPGYKPVTLKAVERVKKAVETTDVFFFDRVSPGALELARYFKSSGSVIFFEPSARGKAEDFQEAIELSDIVKYSNKFFPDVIPSDYRPALEIHTLGERGLQYRTRRQKNWVHRSSCKAAKMVDSCGCGDWTAAGIIHKLFGNGYVSPRSLKRKDIESAVRYGQALGAWNCSFEGARGGMYQVSYRKFQKDIETIMSGGIYKPRNTIIRSRDHDWRGNSICPACP